MADNIALGFLSVSRPTIV